MKKLRWDAAASAHSNSRSLLPGLSREYFEAGRKLLVGLPSPSSLHRFRLDTKTYRYTLELFQPCYGPGLQRRLAVLRQTQNFLGLINDYATTTELVAKHLSHGDPDRAKLEAILKTRAKRKLLELRHYWNRVVDAPGEERRWSNYLARPRK